MITPLNSFDKIYSFNKDSKLRGSEFFGEQTYLKYTNNEEDHLSNHFFN
jgi:hypothetical protein